MFKKITSFYMTGTGNSYMVAKWFIEYFRHAEAALYQIREKQPPINVADSDLLVFSFPTHGLTAPWLVVKHVFQLPKGSGLPAVVLPTRAGTRIWGVSLPGMEGTAGYLIALLLWLRGYNVKGVTAIDMPSNWTAVHWGLNEQNIRIITCDAREKVSKLAHQAASGQTFFNGFIPFLIGLLLAKLSFMYLIIGQLIFSKLFYASNKCSGCGLCQKLCPKQAIKMLRKKPYWTYACDSCMACMNYCPQEAVQASPFSFFIFAYAISLPAVKWLLAVFSLRLAANSGLILFIIQYFYTLSITALIYWLLHKLLYLGPLAAIWSYLSHTKYYRRYKTRDAALQDIHKFN